MTDNAKPGDTTESAANPNYGSAEIQEAQPDWRKIATEAESLKGLLQIFQDPTQDAPQVRPDPGKQELDATGVDTGATLAGVSDLEVADANGEIDVTPYNRILLQAGAVTEDQVVVVEGRHSTSGAWETISPELGGLIPAGESRYLLGYLNGGYEITPFDRLRVRAKYDTTDGGVLKIFGQIWSGSGTPGEVVRRGIENIGAGQNEVVAQMVLPDRATELHVSSKGNTTFRFDFYGSSAFSAAIAGQSGPSNLDNDAAVYSTSIPSKFVQVKLVDESGTQKDHPWTVRAPAK